MTMVKEVTRGELQVAVDEAIHVARSGGMLTVAHAKALRMVAREASRVAVGDYIVEVDGSRVPCPVAAAFPGWRTLTWDLAFAARFDSLMRRAVRAREMTAGAEPSVSAVSGSFVAEVIAA